MPRSSWALRTSRLQGRRAVNFGRSSGRAQARGRPASRAQAHPALAFAPLQAALKPGVAPQVERKPTQQWFSRLFRPRSSSGSQSDPVERPRSGKKESAVKPGSVLDSHSSGMRVAAQLKRPTRKPHVGHMCGRRRRVLPYLVLLQVGFAVPLMLPPARCALTAPFHPYRRRLRGT